MQETPRFFFLQLKLKGFQVAGVDTGRLLLEMLDSTSNQTMLVKMEQGPDFAIGTFMFVILSFPRNKN